MLHGPSHCVLCYLLCGNAQLAGRVNAAFEAIVYHAFWGWFTMVPLILALIALVEVIPFR